jgi:hypothetical protein
MTVPAVCPVVSAARFANRGGARPLRMTQRHEQPLADERQGENIEYLRLSRPTSAAAPQQRQGHALDNSFIKGAEAGIRAACLL